MAKKALLITFLSLSTLAMAQINLDLNLTVKNQFNEQDTTGSVVVDDNTPVSVVFNAFEALVFDIMTHKNEETDDVTILVQISQKTEDGQLIAITDQNADPLGVRVSFGQPGTFTVNDQSADAENNGSLILTIVPSLTE